MSPLKVVLLTSMAASIIVGFVLQMERWLLDTVIRTDMVALRILHRFGVVKSLMVLAMTAATAPTWSRLVLRLLTRHPTIVVQSA